MYLVYHNIIIVSIVDYENNKRYTIKKCTKEGEKMESGKIKISLIVFLFIIAIVIITVLGLMVVSFNKKNESNIAQQQKISNSVQNNTTKNEINNTTNSIVTKDKEYLIDTTLKNKKYEKYITTNGIEGMYITEAIKNTDETYTLKGIMFTKFRIDSYELEDLLKEEKVKLNGKEYTFKENDDDERPYVLEPVKNEKGAYDYYINKIEDNIYEINRAVQLGTIYIYIEDGYSQITVEKDMLIEDEYSGESNTTVEEQFNNLTKEDIQLTEEEIYEDNSFDTNRTFQFETDEEGNCKKIINLTTQI